jgi:hypothetical protein
MRRPAAILLVTLAAIAGTGAAPAAAQRGVTIDRGAPASREYEIPLESARRAAAGMAGASGPSRQGERSAPLFGVGVGPSRHATDPATGTATSGDGAAAPARRAPAAQRPGTGHPVPAHGSGSAAAGGLLAAGVDAGDGSAAAVSVAALALAVLVLGGVLGSIARRRHSGGA